MSKKQHIERKSGEKPGISLLQGEINEIWGGEKWKNLFGHVDISFLVVFRIFFGLVMLVEVYRYFDHNWIERYWITPQFHFSYWPFEFLNPLPGNGMYILFYLMGILSVCIIFGLFYRISTFLFCLSFTYTFLLEQTRYLNHFYLIILLSVVMIFVPANRSVSLDAVFFKNRSETTPAWSLWLLRFTVGVPYFFGGIAKINSDWLNGQPLKMWLSHDMDFPVIGKYFQYDWMILTMAYSSLILDLLTVPLLLFKKTRSWTFVLLTLFHLMNARLFEIGIFPWFMIAATTVYFRPDWARRLVNGLSKNKNLWPIVHRPGVPTVPPKQLNRKQKAIVLGLIFWAIIQVVVPLRHFVYPGNVHWTEEGHMYSWHMKLRTKRGYGLFTIKDKKTGQTTMIDTDDYLTSWQRQKMYGHPRLIWQFCQLIKEDYRKKGIEVEVYADVQATLNGRKYQQLIDPNVDLASVPRPIIPPAPWIIPLKTDLNDRLEE